MFIILHFEYFSSFLSRPSRRASPHIFSGERVDPQRNSYSNLITISRKNALALEKIVHEHQINERTASERIDKMSNLL